MIPLKQSTAFTWKAGPFLDDTDGKTPETGLSIAQADIRLSKAGGDYAQSHNSAGATHDESGNYDVPLDATDTNTLGHMRVMIQKSGALPVWDDFFVYPAKVYDAMTGADNLEVDAIQWNGSSLPTIPPAAPTVGDIRTELSTELGRIDAAISSRLAESSYTEPNNGDITAIKAKTDNLKSTWNDLSESQVNAQVDYALADYDGPTKAELDSGLSDLDVPSAAQNASQVRTELTTELARIDTSISSRLASSAYVAPDNDGIAALPTLTEMEASEVLAKVSDLPSEPPTTSDIDAALTETHGSGSWGTGGVVSKTYTLRDATGNPIPGVICWVTADEEGLYRLDIARETDANGQATFNLFAHTGDTVYVWHRGSLAGDPEVV